MGRTTLPDRVLMPPRKMFPDGGESAGNFVPALDRRDVGWMIERALQLAGYTQQQASKDMGFEGQSHLSAQISGAEPPQFHKLFRLPRFFPCFVEAGTERLANSGIVVETIYRRAR